MGALAQSVVLLVMVVGTIILFLLIATFWLNISRRFIKEYLPHLAEAEPPPEPEDFEQDESLRLAIIAAAIQRHETDRARMVTAKADRVTPDCDWTSAGL